MEQQYTIHEVTALLGISADAIRLYEKEGLVTPSCKQLLHIQGMDKPFKGFLTFFISLINTCMF